MDLRLGPPLRARILPLQEDGLRTGVGQAVGRAFDRAKDRAKDQARDQAPRAEAAAARWVERTRPVWMWLALEWRRLGTAAAILLTMGLLLHAMFGANGMAVYRQKRVELQSLRSEVERLQVENNRHADEIRALKSDPAAIEKEAREQLHYTKRGEVIYVGPESAAKPPTGRAKNEK
jgi:cell division protein FtsB